MKMELLEFDYYLEWIYGNPTPLVRSGYNIGRDHSKAIQKLAHLLNGETSMAVLGKDHIADEGNQRYVSSFSALLTNGEKVYRYLLQFTVDGIEREELLVRDSWRDIDRIAFMNAWFSGEFYGKKDDTITLFFEGAHTNRKEGEPNGGFKPGEIILVEGAKRGCQPLKDIFDFFVSYSLDK
jgi:hypothetical protein